MALALSRNPGECIRIGDDITVEVVSVRDGKAKLAVTAPKEVSIWREEIYVKIRNARDPQAAPILQGQAHG